MQAKLVRVLHFEDLLRVECCADILLKGDLRKMPRSHILYIVLGCALLSCGMAARETEDEFAEFEFDLPGEEEEDFDVGEVEEEEEEEAREEEEEGDEEGFEDSNLDVEEFEEGKEAEPLDRLEIRESAVHVRSSWEGYVLEGLVVAGIVLYLGNYLIGRSKNGALAYTWLDAHSELLNANFALVGDTGEGEEPTEGQLIKESDHVYSLWASGRQHCTGMLVQLKFCRRHDLFSVLTSLFSPQTDTATVVFQVEEEDMDNFVMALGQKKAVLKMQKEYEDLNNFCPSVRPGAKHGLDPSLHLLSELPEASACLLSQHITTFLNRNAVYIESLHISDQYTGFVQDSEDSDMVVVRKPQKRIQFTYSMSQKADKSETFLRFALTVLDHVKGIRLSKEGREKVVRNRTRVAQNIDKLQHAQRQEAAQQRKEDRKRAEKEKLMAESDPEKARKIEERAHKKAMKKKLQPKMKSMKLRVA